MQLRLFRGLVGLAMIALMVFQPQLAAAWGDEGHIYVNRVAAQKLPASMPLFLRRAVDEIAYLGPEPDRWRSPSEFALKNAQEPDHFIDLERLQWLDPLPPGRYEFYRRLYEKRAATADHAEDYLPERVGLQPYITMEVYGRLKAAFRAYRAQQAAHQPTQAVEHAIILYAGWLGHYVADAAQSVVHSVAGKRSSRAGASWFSSGCKKCRSRSLIADECWSVSASGAGGLASVWVY